MPRVMPFLLFATLPLGACAPAGTAAVADAPSATPKTAAPPAPAAPSGTPGAAPRAAQPGAAAATIRGAIRDGNRPPPALRVCAHPVEGGVPTCTDAPAGARDYRIGVAPGRYYLMGWAQGGELQLIAHATQIRCIRAPCPPDELIEVEVAAGDDISGIDLGSGYLALPQGWPGKP